MSSVSFLFDENVSPAIVKFLKQVELFYGKPSNP